MEIKLFNYTSEEVQLQSTDDISKIPDHVRAIRAKSSMWDKGYKGDGIKIGIIDTGIDLNHPDLSQQIITYKNFTNEGTETNVTDYVGHGTWCSGAILANGTKLYGVAPASKLVVAKALSKNGGQIPWIINAIEWLITQDVQIISMSLGSSYKSEEMHTAIKNAVEKGILIVVASGNNGDNIVGNANSVLTDELNYPACFNESISVGAALLNNGICQFSASNNEVDLCSFGQDLVGLAPKGLFCRMSGTSMATPIVAGSLALIINECDKTFGRRLTHAELYAQLCRRTITIPNVDRRLQGNGILRLDAESLLTKQLQS